MDGFLQGLGQNIGIVAVVGMIAVCFVAMAVSQVVSARAKERSRRELAAYVAEGSMTADEAERILSAGGGAGELTECCGSKRKSRRSTGAPAQEANHLSV